MSVAWGLGHRHVPSPARCAHTIAGMLGLALITVVAAIILTITNVGLEHALVIVTLVVVGRTLGEALSLEQVVVDIASEACIYVITALAVDVASSALACVRIRVVPKGALLDAFFIVEEATTLALSA